MVIKRSQKIEAVAPSACLQAGVVMPNTENKMSFGGHKDCAFHEAWL